MKKLFPNTKQPYRFLIIASLFLLIAGIVLTLVSHLLGFGFNGNSDGFSTGEHDVASISVDISAAEIYLLSGDKASVYIDDAGSAHFDYKIVGDTLEVEYRLRPTISFFSFNKHSPTVYITLPDGVSLDADIGAGTIYTEDTINASIDIESGASDIDLTLAGERSNWNFDITAGVGMIDLEGHDSQGGIGSTYNSNHSDARNTIAITTGVGDISVEFEGA